MIRLTYFSPILAAMLAYVAEPELVNNSALLAFCFALSAIAGIGAASRHGQLSPAYAMSAVLNSGTLGFGLAAAMIHYSWPPMLILFACAMTGLSGNLALELIVSAWQEALRRNLQRGRDDKPNH